MTSLRGSILVGAAVWVALPSEALACSIILPAPRPGEAIEAVVDRVERGTQQTLRGHATHIFLARVLAHPRRPSNFQPVVALKGDTPPRQMSAASREPCEPTTPAPGELRIVFAQRISISDMPWRPWRWGDLVVIGSRRPDEVRDPELATLLRRAARRAAND